MIENIWSEGYGMIPKRLFRDPNLKKTAIIVYSYLLTYTGAGKNAAWPSVQTISKDTQTGKTTVIEALKSLEDFGYLTKEKLKPNDPFNNSHKYIIHCFSTVEGSKNEPCKSSENEPSPINNNYNNIYIEEIIEYLNSTAEKQFKASTKSTQKLINGRLADGYTVEDFKKVIDCKVSHWLKDIEMNQYLQPSTLFNVTNFEKYINQSFSAPKSPARPTCENCGANNGVKVDNHGYACPHCKHYVQDGKIVNQGER